MKCLSTIYLQKLFYNVAILLYHIHNNKYMSLGFSDGVKSFKIDDWSGVKGCYIKLLDPKRVIPVRMMEFTIGYYYIYDESGKQIFHSGIPSE